MDMVFYYLKSEKSLITHWQVLRTGEVPKAGLAFLF